MLPSKLDMVDSLTKYFIPRLDISGDSTTPLYEYISARTQGEVIGQCDEAYPQCTFTIFNILHGDYLENMVP